MPANATGRTAPSVFRQQALTPAELATFCADFDRDGFVLLQSCLTEEGSAGLAAEMLEHPKYMAWVDGLKHGDNPRFGLRPWDVKGAWSDQLFDAPLVQQLLGAVMRRPYHLCHTTLCVGHPGARSIGFHQDHHHWNNALPVNLHQRDGYYIQMLYYPSGFTAGDGSLFVLPGSHKFDSDKLNPFVKGQGDPARPDSAGRPFLPPIVSDKYGLHPITFDASPGSCVFLNARCFHGVAAQLPDSALAQRLFVNMIYKESDGAGDPPHRFTQPIPDAWLQGDVSNHRRQIFDRQPYSADTEDPTLPNAWETWERPASRQARRPKI